MPCSMSSTRTRLSLRERCFAMVSTCLAIFGGRVMLRRTWLARDRFGFGIVAPLYTILVHIEADFGKLSVELERFLLRRTAPHRSERLAVQRSRTIQLQRCQVLRCAVPLVRSQAIFREDRIPLAHHAVALDLGQNRSRRDRGGERIAVNNRPLRQFAIEAH